MRSKNIQLLITPRRGIVLLSAVLSVFAAREGWERSGRHATAPPTGNGRHSPPFQRACLPEDIRHLEEKKKITIGENKILKNSVPSLSKITVSALLTQIGRGSLCAERAAYFACQRAEPEPCTQKRRADRNLLRNPPSFSLEREELSEGRCQRPPIALPPPGRAPA